MVAASTSNFVVSASYDAWDALDAAADLAALWAEDDENPATWTEIGNAPSALFEAGFIEFEELAVLVGEEEADRILWAGLETGIADLRRMQELRLAA